MLVAFVGVVVTMAVAVVVFVAASIAEKFVGFVEHYLMLNLLVELVVLTRTMNVGF